MGRIERSDERDRAVEAALPHVALEGWTASALRAGLRDAGFDEADLTLLFPDGPVEAVEVWCDLADRRMAAALAEIDLAALRIRERVATAVMIRFEQAAPHREAVRRALALLALPPHAGAAARTTARTVDAVWRGIGDRSTDFNWYTKRATLAGVYGATLLYWLNDDSEDAARTRQFLDRRIEALMLIPKLQKTMAGIASRLPDPFRLLGRLRGAA